jgi:tetratricopeptide (TPR) repeat protein
MGLSRASRSKARPDPPPVSRDHPDRRWAWAAAIVAAGLLAYSNSLKGPFVFDDLLSIVDNESIRDWSRIGVALSPEREFPTAGRPLVNFSFALNYAFGGLEVTGYHLVNIALHMVCGLVIFGIIRRTLELPGIGAPRQQAMAAGFATALLWILHPLNTEAVDYVTQRSELMMGLCYVTTIYAALRAWTTAGAATRWSAIAVTVCAAGTLCKESMVTAPLMVALYDRVFLFDSFAQALTARRRLYLGLTASWIAAAAVIWSGPRVHSAGFSSGVSAWTYLLNQTVMIVRYLRLAIWPRDLVANYGWPLPLTLREVLPQALIVVVLIAVASVAVARRPRWGFLGAWFFVTLAPASSVVPIATEVGAERRMYLPLVALLALLVVAAGRFAQRAGRAGWITAAAALAVVSVLLAAGTFVRNREYQSALVLARTSVERYPTSVGHHVLATELIVAGDREQARAELRAALPGAPRAHYTLGVELLEDGQAEAARIELEAFLREQPMLLEAVSARQLLGRALARQNRWAEAIEEYRRALTMNPSSEMRIATQASLGEALYRVERFGEAAAVYSEYVKARPDDVNALNFLGISLLALDRQDEAIGVFTRAITVDPENGATHRNLANALFDRGDVDGAARHAAEATRLRIDDPAAWDLLGRVSAIQGNLEAARVDFAHALRIDPASSEAQEHLRAVERLLASRGAARQ